MQRSEQVKWLRLHQVQSCSFFWNLPTNWSHFRSFKPFIHLTWLTLRNSGFARIDHFSGKLKAYEEPLRLHQKAATEDKRSINISLMVQLMTQEFQGEKRGKILSVLNEAFSVRLASDSGALSPKRFKRSFLSDETQAREEKCLKVLRNDGYRCREVERQQLRVHHWGTARGLAYLLPSEALRSL